MRWRASPSSAPVAGSPPTSRTSGQGRAGRAQTELQLFDCCALGFFFVSGAVKGVACELQHGMLASIRIRRATNARQQLGVPGLVCKDRLVGEVERLVPLCELT